jgi:hypothetical protein
MGTCRPRWAFPGDNAADDSVALMIVDVPEITEAFSANRRRA